MDLSNPGAASRSESVVAILDGALQEWAPMISAVIDAQNKKNPRGRGPLPEVEYWRERNASFSAVFEQLNLPEVLR